MNEIDLRDLLPPERPMPAGRRREMKERLLEQIEQEGQTSRRRYRVFAGALAAAILVVAGAVAVLVSRDEPTETVPSDPSVTTPPTSEPTSPEPNDALAPRLVPNPEEAAVATHNVAGAAAAAPPEMLHASLSAGRVQCVEPDFGGPVKASMAGNDQVRELAFGDLLTADMLITQCSYANWATEEQLQQTDVFDTATARACVREGTYPLAVVALEGLTCQEVAGSGVTVRDITDEDLAQLNRLRAIEVALLANPDDCPSDDEATRWAEAVVAQENIDGDVGPLAGDGIPEVSECYQPVVLSWSDDPQVGGLHVGVAMITPPTETP